MIGSTKINKGKFGNKLGRRAFLKKTGISIIALGSGTFLVACNGEATVPAPQATSLTGFEATALAGGNSTPQATVGTGRGTPTAVAGNYGNPKDAATAFLKAWQEKRYKDMYTLLSDFAKSAITEERFVGRYEAITQEATILAVEPAIRPDLPPLKPNEATYEVQFSVKFKTARVGDFSQNNKLAMQWEGNKWGINWMPTNIFTQLEGTRLVRLFAEDAERGLIVDRGGLPLAKEGFNYSVYVVPGRVENEAQLLEVLSQNLGMERNAIRAKYQNGQPDWKMPVKEISGETPQAVLDKMTAAKGVGVEKKKIRSYPQGTSGAHIVGYITAVTADDLKRLAGKGYRESDLVGRVGIEEWGEERLAGGKGGRLTVVESDGKLAEVIKTQTASSAGSFTLTLDTNIQKMTEQVLGERMGSIVVITPDGAVLAMASFPRYNPNDFVAGMTTAQFNALNNDPRRPFQHRAVNGALPMGSTFKVVTTAAALERLGMKMDARFNCTGRWTALGEQNAKDCYIKTGHGSITLYEGLVQSCDYVYYEIGKKLDELDPILLPAVSKGFGLGSSTGIVGIYDSPGQIPDPAWKKSKLNDVWVRGDAVNLGIGQGYMLATPLQVAAAYAGLANGGAIPELRLVSKIDGGNPQVFESKVKQTIPLSPGNMAQLRNALKDVTGGGSGGGTARGAFGGSRVKVAGKTGTAESGKEEPHAWFACYAPADNPKYVIVVVLENGGFGSEKAAPLARQVIDKLEF
jgi:penicillin-binding protein 2